MNYILGGCKKKLYMLEFMLLGMILENVSWRRVNLENGIAGCSLLSLKAKKRKKFFDYKFQHLNTS